MREWRKPDIKMDTNKFFTEIGNDSPYVKAAFEGFAGSGKTYTAAQVAIGLYKQTKSEKPVVIFDTEKSSRFLKPIFTEAGIKVLVKESRQLIDLVETMKFCSSGGSDILIIDSITHIWESFVNTYKVEMKRDFIQFQDWNYLKTTWKSEFSEPLVQARYNIMFTGRAGFEYEQQTNDVTGKKEIVKSGIKMKVEGETAYEPDILILMERFEKVLDDDKQVWREATILKDRSGTIDGKTFKFTAADDSGYVWQCFKPMFDYLSSDVVPQRENSEGDTAKMIQKPGNNPDYKHKQTVLLEEIQGIFDLNFPKSTAEAKSIKAKLIQDAFGTMSWSKIEKMNIEELDFCRERLVEYIEKLKQEAEVNA